MTTGFELNYKKTGPIVEPGEMHELDRYRDIFYSLKLIGERIAGVGYGNMSQRLEGRGEGHDCKTGKRQFAITGRGCSTLENISINDYAQVIEYDIENNLVTAEGPVAPSSEALMHGAVYDFDQLYKSVVHAHSRQIWDCAKELGIPMTPAYAEKGTKTLAIEAQKALESTNAKDLGIIALGGHRDGIIAFGKSPRDACMTIINYFTAALEIACNYAPLTKVET